MPPIRHSNRALKPRVFWEPSIPTPRRRQPPTFTIYSDTLEAPPEAYQPQFLPENRAGKPQNMPREATLIKLFQLFFPVKEIKNIVKQSNQWAISIGLYAWKPITIEEIYHYLGCLIYKNFYPLNPLIPKIKLTIFSI